MPGTEDGGSILISRSRQNRSWHQFLETRDPRLASCKQVVRGNATCFLKSLPQEAAALSPIPGDAVKVELRAYSPTKLENFRLLSSLSTLAWQFRVPNGTLNPKPYTLKCLGRLRFRIGFRWFGLGEGLGFGALGSDTLSHGRLGIRGWGSGNPGLRGGNGRRQGENLSETPLRA